MNLTLKIKLKPSSQQKQLLKTTMSNFNEACNYIASIAYEHKMANKAKLQPLVYYDIRKQFNLSSQMAVRAISKTVEAYKRNKTIQPKFRQYGSMIYDQRIMSWKTLDRVSLLTLEGRELIPYVMCDYHKSRFDRIRGQADLILVKGTLYLCVVVDTPEPKQIQPLSTLGVDLGITNIAADSTGQIYSGKAVNKTRQRLQNFRSKLQQCGTKSAKRHLKKLSKHEYHFITNQNHIISKEIVGKAKDTQSRISLEDLKGIRERTTVKKSQRYRHNSWSFYQLKNFIEYKAKLSGVPTIVINPAYTSQQCPECGYIHKDNRNRSKFKCGKCDFVGHADHTAAINIAAKVDVNQPIVAQSQLQAHEFIHG